MARPVWRGAITFGLVTIPVELHSATEDHGVRFRQYQRDTDDRVRYRRVNERTSEEVDYQDIVKGYEFEDGTVVHVEQRELDEIAPGRSRTIDIDSFVRTEQIDPVYFQRSYWLAPGSEEHGRAYALLQRAMAQSGRAGIARFVMRGKEYLAALRAGETTLALDTLLFADEVRTPAEGPEVQVRDKEVQMALSLIDSMSAEWRPEDYADTYAERVRKLLEDKRAGHAVRPARDPEPATEVVDLFEALSRSVRGAGEPKGRRSGRSRTASHRQDEPGGRAELTKKELERRARELGVPGRSKLGRDELAEAVAEAERKGRRAS
ncbi:Ku protein [Sciscionella marina]|uniref:non-homologous end joining protein Ku n=1 Tax=Sciscionella marina TaxID=508770 RepID=UPI00036FAF02|nr:Ku protein [Sciscionella marina]